jgi:LacI family transcriptional regulator, repressor for deo operon, udp, cdd, tsx, nupC, and nupG
VARRSENARAMGISKSPRSRLSRNKTSGERRINIGEVAEAAGVSVATVSRALQMPNVVAAKTLKRVQKAVIKLGYAPNAQARMLRTARSNVIVAMVPDISNPFFAEIIRGIEHVAQQNRYSVLLGDTQYDLNREQAYADLLSTRQADGLITLLPHIPRLSARSFAPIVNACEYVTDPAVPSVYVNNLAAGQDATNYLLSLGHIDIAFVSGPMTSPICADRFHGYEDALRTAGVRRNPDLTVTGDFSVESGIRALDGLFAREAKFTAVFCSNDEMAIGAIRALKSRGRRVPEEVSVVGFDDIRFARYCDPPLTTIAQPKDELGREAMNMMIEILNDPNVPARKHILPTQLVVRGSTAPCAHHSGSADRGADRGSEIVTQVGRPNRGRPPSSE